MKKYLSIFVLCFCASCSSYLDVKPDKKLVVPETAGEVQTLLNNIFVLSGSYPASGEISSDCFYLDDKDWLSTNTSQERNAYIWQEDVFNDNPRNDWSLSYEKVYYANLVIDWIDNGSILSENLNETNDLKGQALFFRAYAFYHLLQIFAPHYDSKTAKESPGIVLRLSSDFNIPSQRATVEQCYQQVLSDVLKARDFLYSTESFRTRPTKVAASAFLARIYLTMGNYEDALNYSTEALDSNSALMNYNDKNPNAFFSFSRFNEEVILHTFMATPFIFYPPTLKIEPSLLALYEPNDLRPGLFFSQNPDGTFSFKGSYDGAFSLFNGLTTNETYLIKAECLARDKKINDAVETLSELLKKRYKEGKLPELCFENDQELITFILKERKKELLFRGLRWTDLRRLANEPPYSEKIMRKVNNQIYTLTPGDKRYVFKIPEEVIKVTGILQNP